MELRTSNYMDSEIRFLGIKTYRSIFNFYISGMFIFAISHFFISEILDFRRAQIRHFSNFRRTATLTVCRSLIFPILPIFNFYDFADL